MLNKQSIDFAFSQGLDLKTDPKRISVGKFLSLENSVFTKSGQLTKRFGFAPLTTLPTGTDATYLCSFSSNLTAISNSLLAYSAPTKSWVNKGNLQPVALETLPLIRANTNQTQCDSVVASNGLVCTVYTDIGSGSTLYKYVIADSTTGQNIVAPVAIPVSSGTVTGSPRVFLLGGYFVIVFTNVITAVSHLQYIAVSVNSPTTVTTNADIASSYISATTLSWDGVVVNNNLYVAYNTTTGGQAIKVTYLTSGLTVVTAVTFAGRKATVMNMSADVSSPSAPVIYAAFFDSAGSTGYVLAVDTVLNTVLAPTQWIAAGTILNIASAAQNGVVSIFYEVLNTYSYDSSIKTNYVALKTYTLATSGLSAEIFVKRSVGLASKATIWDGVIYFLTAYSSPYQPTYFLISSTGYTVVAKLAYSNGGGYLTLGLPNVSMYDNVIQMPYLIKDLVQAANKTQGLANPNPVYSQTGINLASFAIGGSDLSTGEIGENLNISGGFLWAYDGYSPVEQGFHLWPDSIELGTATTGGHLADQIYYYQVTYEWSDNQGNVFRSAPSVPVTITTTGGGNSTVTINVPTLRVTAKIANPVKLVVYRWSTAQQIYYQVTSITSPVLNTPSVDSIAIVDTLADSSIIGNNILYTTGGVLENIGPPATSLVTLFNDRLFLVDSEDRNLLWFSKQVIESTPVEMSDLLTIYVAPSIGAQGPTGPMSAISAMDDKLIIFKKNAINYINGSGPDNTGANNQYSDPIFITATVGCDNQQSIVFTPSGLMFQSDKGIWILKRNLDTSFIGAPVSELTKNAVVLSALTVPGTNQVRFTLDSGITLMYDYYYEQWATFVNIPGVSSTLYEGLHTYLSSAGLVLQEKPNTYLDNSSPVLMQFTTGWMNLAGFQGYERFYFMFLNGDYITPFKLNMSLSYDFIPSPSQSIIVTPDNVPSNWGSDTLWGSGPDTDDTWGGASTNFEARVFPSKQKCETFQISMQEVFDSQYSVMAGAGLTLSGLNIVIGTKKGYRTSSASRSFG